MALLLEGVLRGGDALDLDALRLDLQRLLGLGGEDQLAGDNEGRAHVLPGHLLVVVQGIGIHHHLEIPEAGAVVELHEAEGLHVPDGPGPAAHGDGLAVQGPGVGEEGRDLGFFHIISPAIIEVFRVPPE